MNDSDFTDEEFFNQAQQTQRRFAWLGFAFFVFIILLVSTIIYFFLAAAGVLPPVDVIPFVPYV